VLVPAGSFMMGSTNGGTDEKPVHQVTISQAFYMGKYEVTQGQWQTVMGNNPSNFKDCGGNCPVEQVSWDDAQNFINKLNESNDGFRYRLPTEAEWEYACRAGTTGDYAGILSEMAWYGKNSGSKTHAVGGKQPNAWGLADMHGNVWEWCQDWYHETYYGAPTDGSAWLSGGEQEYRVLRGGSWGNYAEGLRSAVRDYGAPDSRVSFNGFRVIAVR
jgi:formylglycine-generating enzyme required for sulfatase activity